MNYTTQMDAARRGIQTKELKKVAEKEKFDIAELMKLVAEGKVATGGKCVRLHAENKDQCKSGQIQGLHGSQHGTGKGK